MLRFKQWVVSCATNLLQDIERDSNIEPVVVPVQCALSKLDVEKETLPQLLQLWLTARSVQRYAHHTRKLREYQEVLRALRH